jgi:hypothetical protein
MGKQQSTNAGILGTAFNPGAGAPAAGNASTIGQVPGATTSFDPGSGVQTGLDLSGLANAGNIQTSYGPGAGGLTDYTQQVQQALMGQLNPQLDIQKQQLEQQLADQGIRYGSQAYNNAMLPFGQQQNQAWLGAVTGATGQAKTLMDIANAQGTFANQAQAQAFQQALGAGGFTNAAQGQQFQQNAAQATFQNSGLAQQLAQAQSTFNAQQAARNQNLQEQYMQRNQPLNEIAAMMSGSQIQAPSWINAPQSQIPTTDVAGLINNQFNQQLGVYQQQNQNYQSLMGGILGLGARAEEPVDRLRRARQGKHRADGHGVCRRRRRRAEETADLCLQLQGRSGIDLPRRADGAGRRADRSIRRHRAARAEAYLSRTGYGLDLKGSVTPWACLIFSRPRQKHPPITRRWTCAARSRWR